MKKLILLPLLAALAVPVLAMGPDGPEGPGPGGPGMHGGPGMGPGGPGGDVDPVSMKEALGLSEAQVAKLKALKDDRKDVKAQRRQLRDLMLKLQDQVEDGAGESALAATLKEIDALQAKLHDEQMKLKAQRDAVLTAAQRAKLLAKRGGKMKERMDRREERQEERRERRQGRQED